MLAFKKFHTNSESGIKFLKCFKLKNIIKYVELYFVGFFFVFSKVLKMLKQYLIKVTNFAKKI